MDNRDEVLTLAERLDLWIDSIDSVCDAGVPLNGPSLKQLLCDVREAAAKNNPTAESAPQHQGSQVLGLAKDGSTPSGGDSYEHYNAIREGHEIVAEDEYFKARPQIDCRDRRNVFKQGFDRGFDIRERIACAPTPPTPSTAEVEAKAILDAANRIVLELEGVGSEAAMRQVMQTARRLADAKRAQDKEG